jgi:hypothetical protein
MNTQKKILEDENSELRNRVNQLEKHKVPSNKSSEKNKKDINISAKNYITMNDDAFSGKNMFNV